MCGLCKKTNTGVKVLETVQSPSGTEERSVLLDTTLYAFVTNWCTDKVEADRVTVDLGKSMI